MPLRGKRPCDDADELYRASLEIAGGDVEVTAVILRQELCKRDLHVPNDQIYALVKRLRRNATQLEGDVQEVERVQEVGRRWGAAEAMELLSSAADDPFLTQLLSFVAEPNPVQAGALVITVYVRLQTGTCRIDGLQPSDNVRLLEEKTAAKSGVREGFRLYLNSKLLDSLSTLHESQVCNGAFIEMKMLGPGGMQLTTSQEEALSIAFSDEPEETEVKQLLASQTTWLDQHERCLKGSLKRGGSVAAGSSSGGGDGGGSGSGSGGGGAASGGSRTPDTPRRRCCDGEQSPTGWLKAAAKKSRSRTSERSVSFTLSLC